MVDSKTALADAAIDTLRQNIQSKLAQLKHYRDNDAQLNHAKTIAEGRILQLEQVSHWVEMCALASPPPSGAREALGKKQIIDVLRKHLKIGGHDAWEGNYYYVDGIEVAAEALSQLPATDTKDREQQK